MAEDCPAKVLARLCLQSDNTIERLYNGIHLLIKQSECLFVCLLALPVCVFYALQKTEKVLAQEVISTVVSNHRSEEKKREEDGCGASNPKV